MAEKALSRGEIFVVDDDPAVRDTLSMVLSAGGYQVICFADGAALLAVARTRTPSCVLLDVHIPGKSGLDILKELHGEDYPAPIFMISGQGDIAMAVNAIKSGALDFIEKPFRGSEIVARLDEAIEAYARRQAETLGSPDATNDQNRDGGGYRRRADEHSGTFDGSVQRHGMRRSHPTGYRTGIRRPVQRNTQVACRPVKGFHRCYSVRHDFGRRLFWLDRERSFRNCLPPVADLLSERKNKEV